MNDIYRGNGDRNMFRQNLCVLQSKDDNVNPSLARGKLEPRVWVKVSKDNSTAKRRRGALPISRCPLLQILDVQSHEAADQVSFKIL